MTLSNTIQGDAALLSSLIAYFKLEGNVTDSHDSNDGTAEKTISTVSGILRNCINFDGAGAGPYAIGAYQGLDLDQILAGVNSFSISWWDYLGNTGAIGTPVSLACWTGSAWHADSRFAVQKASGTSGAINVYYWASSGNLSCSSTFAASTWTHWVFTVDYNSGSGNTTLSFYKNGIRVSQQAGLIGAGKASAFKTLVGLVGYGASSQTQRFQPVNGKIDEIAIANRAWTDEEVLKLYHSGYPLRYDEVFADASGTAGATVFDLEPLAYLPMGYTYASVTGLVSAPGPLPKEITLDWTNPVDPDFSHVRILRSETSPPLTPGSGLEVYNGALETFTDTDLDPTKTYYYSVFAYDVYGSYSDPESVSEVPHELYARFTSVQVLAPNKFRAKFDQKMTIGTDDENDVTKLANWSVDSEAFDVHPTAVELAQTTPTWVDITLNADGTVGAFYTAIVAATVTDDEGGSPHHPVDPAYREVEFTGLGQAPKIVSAFSLNLNQVIVGFSEAVVGADDKSHYSIPGLVISDADVYDAGLFLYALTTSTQTALEIYTVTGSAIFDLAGNPLDPEFDSFTFTGCNRVTVTSTPNEALNLDMYRFLIQPIRDADSSEDGNLFLKRFLAGPQELWSQTQNTIFRIKDLWNVSETLDENIDHLKQIVGWVGKEAALTESLDTLTLRRLIRASIPIWKNRSTENTISNVLNLLVSRQARIWNWFDFRWITGDELEGGATIFGEQRQGRDPWLISFPYENEQAEYWSNLRIKTPDDKALLREVIKLMRPLGERFNVVYLLFIDMFNYENDLSQWTLLAGDVPEVTDGMLKLENDAQDQATFASAENHLAWTDYVLSMRIRTTISAAGQLSGAYVRLTPGSENGYYVGLDIQNNLLRFGRVSAGVRTQLAQFDFYSINYTLQDGFWYGLRVQAISEGGTSRFIVFFDGEERINVTDSNHDMGTVACFHDSGATCQVDEIEVMGLPVDSETIELN